MTKAEILAHNRGVLSVVEIAEASAAALRLRLRERPTRFNHAIEALDALAAEGRLLLIGPNEPSAAAEPPRPRPLAPQGREMEAVRG